MKFYKWLTNLKRAPKIVMDLAGEARQDDQCKKLNSKLEWSSHLDWMGASFGAHDALELAFKLYNRKPAHYWVQDSFGNNSFAYWNGSVWLVCGDTQEYSDEQLCIVETKSLNAIKADAIEQFAEDMGDELTCVQSFTDLENIVTPYVERLRNA